MVRSRALAGSVALVAVLGGSVSSSAEGPAASGGPPTEGDARATGPRVYSRLLDPREHPDRSRRHVRPPTWETFGGRTRFTSLRGFAVEGDEIVRYAEDLDRYTRTHRLGDVIWPSYPILFARNLGDLADEIRRRDLFLFDIWGFVPGSGPGGYWQQFRPPPGVFELLEEKLGERWLGMDVGEQDGRYVGGYASQMVPASAPRFEQYLAFQRHFQRMCDGLGNRMAALVSLNFGHYFLKDGVYTLLGAETAQGLPNGQVYYAFIRGAGKQYGVPWFGNASIFNRWGWKVYGAEGRDGGYAFGPTKGTSLSLLRRLLYSHILYNCVIVGFENGWFEGEALSPIGRIQQAAARWVEENGPPGVQVAPIGVLLDFSSGWSFPRHLYTGDTYRVWGNLPYGPGDHLTDGVLDMLYPGYQDSSYFHDESGFLTPTPYGDAADCLLSDAEPWLLRRYALLVVAGELSGGAEARDKIEAYAADGGRVVISAANLARFPDGLAGVRVAGPAAALPAGSAVAFRGVEIPEPRAFELVPLVLPEGAEVVASCGGTPAAVRARRGRGIVTVLASPFGIPSVPAVTSTPSEVDRPLPRPFPLLEHVRAVLARELDEQVLFTAGEGLSTIVCRKGPGEYTVGVENHSLRERALRIESRIGAIESVRELPVSSSEAGAVGWLPEGFESAPIGEDGPATIAGGSVRVFSVTLRADGAEEIPHAAPPPRPRGRWLFLRSCRSIQEEVLARPTFFEHWDGVVVDWKWLRDRDREAARREAGWIGRQGLRVAADLSSGVNLYPELRLIDNVPEDHAATLATIGDVIEKLAILGGRDLILSLHRFPENNFTGEQTTASFEATLRRICSDAAAGKVTVHLRVVPGKFPWSVAEAAGILDRVGAPNLRLAPSTAPILQAGSIPEDLRRALDGRLGIWMAGAPQTDALGKIWGAHGPVASGASLPALGDLLRAWPEVPVVLDAVFADRDAEYRDARAIEAARGVH